MATTPDETFEEIVKEHPEQDPQDHLLVAEKMGIEPARALSALNQHHATFSTRQKAEEKVRPEDAEKDLGEVVTDPEDRADSARAQSVGESGEEDDPEDDSSENTTRRTTRLGASQSSGSGQSRSGVRGKLSALKDSLLGSGSGVSQKARYETEDGGMVAQKMEDFEREDSGDEEWVEWEESGGVYAAPAEKAWLAHKGPEGEAGWFNAKTGEVRSQETRPTSVGAVTRRSALSFEDE